MNIIKGILIESGYLFNEMAFYLMIGFLFAGILHIFISPKTIAKHLGKNNLLSVIKAALFGMPLPLCSCGVIPAAMSIKKEGASKGATLSFLISTPTTGVDSILATYSLLGWLFAVFRIIVSIISGMIAGIISNIFIKENNTKKTSESSNMEECKTCGDSECIEEHTFVQKINSAFKYAFIELLDDISGWLIIGIIAGGIISYFIPDDFFSNYINSGWQAMIVMLVIGIPIYVCATGSIPIAAALMIKGMNPGAAFVFLFAGPATNAVTVTVIGKELGKKSLIIYLATIICSSIIFGLALNVLWDYLGISFKNIIYNNAMMPEWILIFSSIILGILITFSFIRRFKENTKININEKNKNAVVLNLEGMTCRHCAETIKKIFIDKFDIQDVEINLKDQTAKFINDNNADLKDIISEIEKSGYKVIKSVIVNSA